MLRNAVGGGGVSVRFSGKKRYKGVRFNVICVTRGGWRSNDGDGGVCVWVCTRSRGCVRTRVRDVIVIYDNNIRIE